MYQKRIAEIEARKAEIAKEIEGADEQRTKELDTEVDGLNTELATPAPKQAVANKLTEIPGSEGGEDKEERAEEIYRSKKLTLSADEVRRGLASLRSTPDHHRQPGEAHRRGSDHRRGLQRRFSIVDQVRVMDCTGCGEWTEAYVKSMPEADDGTDGTAPDPSDPCFPGGGHQAQPGQRRVLCVQEHREADPCPLCGEGPRAGSYRASRQGIEADRERQRRHLLRHQERGEHQERGHLHHPGHDCEQREGRH